MHLTQPFIFLLTFCFILLFYPSVQDVTVKPPYCSHDMDSRAIPSLSDSQLAKNPKLLQVQTLIRHGARTPYMKMFCWDGYDIVWNCNVTFLEIPSNKNYGTDVPSPLLFRKLYDSYPNELGGTCFTGQLIEEGYSQELANGRHLKEAYIGTSDEKLFSSSKISDLDLDEIHIRGDDEQRTLMSGQLVIEGFFDADEQTIIPYHSGDYSLDTIYPNSGVCPALNSAQTQAQNSPEYQAINSSDATNNLVSKMDSVLGSFSWDSILDCLMTTHCTGHEVPTGITNKMFNDSIGHVEWDTAFTYTYNNSRYAKLAMVDLVNDVITEINKWKTSGTGKKFVLYSAHDTTVMPFLATFGSGIWDQLWAPYASMINIELYQIDSELYFRMIYNGKELILPNCDDSLCQLEMFEEVTSWTSGHLDCSVRSNPNNIQPRRKNNQYPHSNYDNNKSGHDTKAFIVVVVLSVSIGAIFGAVLVFYNMKSKFKNQHNYSSLNSSINDNSL